uniref:Uncharacterized protein n=1 Tax=Panagrolaimus sp. PS1159 TaxID=55785 RepID=A0AC35GJZ9_9BILA
MMTRDSVKGIFDKDWINTISDKTKNLEAAANFDSSKMCESEPKIDAQISRLMDAVRLTDPTKAHVSDLPTEPSHSAAPPTQPKQQQQQQAPYQPKSYMLSPIGIGNYEYFPQSYTVALKK